MTPRGLPLLSNRVVLRSFQAVNMEYSTLGILKSEFEPYFYLMFPALGNMHPS